MHNAGSTQTIKSLPAPSRPAFLTKIRSPSRSKSTSN